MTNSSEKNVLININTSSVFKTLAILALFYGLFFLRDIVLVVLTSVLLASAIEPATVWFGKRRIPRILAVLSIYLVGIIFFSSIFYFLLIPLLAETTNLLENLPDYLSVLEVWNPTQDGFLGQPVLKDLSESFSIQEFANQASALLSGSINLLGVASALFGGTLSLILIVVLSFYLAVQEAGVAKFLRLVTPIKYETYATNLWKRTEIKIGLWVQGQIVLAVIVGVLTYLGLMLLGISNALLLAFLAAVFEIIPVFGPIIAAVPAVMIGVTDGGPTLAFLVTGLYIIIQQFESQLLHPLVVKKVVGLPPIVVILALIVGFKLAGFLGILLAVPLATIALVFFEDWENRKHPK